MGQLTPENRGVKAMNYYVYRLIPPRPTFDRDMSDGESEIMEQHFSYWQGVLDRGKVVVYGPVSDPAGTWGLAVIEAETDDDARALGVDDPAVKSGMATFEIYPMPLAVVRP
jgi:uncharacterized protein YciI